MNTPAGGVTLPELLPCPCGHQVDPEECPYPVPVGYEEWHQIGCIDGNCMWLVVAPTADEAIAAWNTRAALAATAQQTALPPKMETNDPRIPYTYPPAHIAYRDGWNAALDAANINKESN